MGNHRRITTTRSPARLVHSPKKFLVFISAVCSPLNMRNSVTKVPARLLQIFKTLFSTWEKFTNIKPPWIKNSLHESHNWPCLWENASPAVEDFSLQYREWPLEKLEASLSCIPAFCGCGVKLTLINFHWFFIKQASRHRTEKTVASNIWPTIFRPDDWQQTVKAVNQPSSSWRSSWTTWW